MRPHSILSASRLLSSLFSSSFRLWALLVFSTLSSTCLVQADAPRPAIQEKDAPPPAATEKEIKLGDRAAADFEKNPKVKLLDGTKDEKAKTLLDKLNKMTQELGKASSRPQIKYTVKVVDDTEVNAFTLPNGRIYFYRGLVELLGSDDELAAVLAHEIGHNARMHALRGEAKARKLSWISLATVLAALAGGSSGGDVMQFSQYLLVGIMNGYGVEYEKEADAVAVDMLIKTSYNPSALVSVMRRFEVEERRRPKMEMGIFQTHPPSEERAKAIEEAVRKAGLPFTPRAVSGSQEAIVIEAKDRVSVQFGKVTLLEFALQPQQSPQSPQSPSATQRAQQAAQNINALIRDNLKMHEIRADASDNGARITARGTEIARLTPADAKLYDLSPLACAQKWRDNFRRIFWRETINGAL